MNRRSLVLGAGAAVVLVLLWWVALWSPAKGEVDKAKERRQGAEEQATQLRNEIQRLRAAQRNEPEQRAKLERLKGYIPDDPNLAQFILDTNDAAVRAGIDFISVAPSLPTAGSATGGQAAATTTPTTASAAATAAIPAEVRVALQIQGGYFQILDFLNRLDQMPRLVVTDSLNVSADASARLTVAVTARIFTKSVPAAFGGTATTTTVAGATTTTVPGATTTTAAGGAATTTVPGATTTTTAAGATP